MLDRGIVGYVRCVWVSAVQFVHKQFSNAAALCVDKIDRRWLFWVGITVDKEATIRISLELMVVPCSRETSGLYIVRGVDVATHRVEMSFERRFF